MEFTKTLILIVSLLCLLTHTTTAIRTPQARVWTICKPTTNPLLCYKTILPQVGARFNMYKALEIEVLATQKQVQKTAGIIEGLLAKSGNSKSIAESLATCKEQYGNMVDSIAETIKLVAQRNAVEARFKFSTVLSYHATCNDEFSGIPSPIANDAQGVYDLGGNSLDIMKAIEDKERSRRTRKGNYYIPSSSPCQGVIGPCS